MASDPKILCFRHCSSKSVFCLNVPAICPACNTTITKYKLPPFLVPYPYKNAAEYPDAIVVRPSIGNFLTEYNMMNDLHIGITNSCGIVYEYDHRGLIVDDALKWATCIVIKFIPSYWQMQWHKTILDMLGDLKWVAENYDVISMNCFDFVLEFVNRLNYGKLHFDTKEKLCEQLILLRVRDAIKYNYIHMNLRNAGHFII